MGIKTITALEIFTNPGDLQIIIGQKEKGAKFAVAITRGPGHNFKLMLTLKPFAKTQEEAIKAIEEILQTVRKDVTREFKDLKSLSTQYLNPDNQKIDQSKVLNQDLIERILEELRVHRIANTFEMLAPVG
ncbi:MAG: hypothetical protein KAS07_01635 [Candidatus Pacebacteria bacterium]|nr:hypothetical protein [Candidatus Paceibacterota bacterium]